MCEQPGQAPVAAPSPAGPAARRGSRGRGEEDRLAGRETAAAASAPEEVIPSIDDQEFRLAVEVLYHGSRQAFFAGSHRWMMFATILLGASAAASFGGERLCGLLAAAAAAADIAFDFTGRAQQHADLRRRYYDMVAELSPAGGVENFGPRWMAISSDEPPVYRIVDEIAYRNACIALDRDVPTPVPWRRRLLAHLVRG